MRASTTTRWGLIVAIVVAAAGCSSPRDAVGATYTVVDSIGERGEGPAQFHEPMGIAVDVDGDLYIADTRNRRIQVLSASGEFLRSWGNAGDAAGAFQLPVDVAVGPDGISGR